MRRVARKVGLYDLEVVLLWDVISRQVDLYMTKVIALRKEEILQLLIQSLL